MFTWLLLKAWSMASWKSLVFKITCHIKTNNYLLDECTRTSFQEEILGKQKGWDYWVFNSAYNSISEHRVICRAEFCLGTDPCESEGFIEFMGGCKGTLPCGSLWRFFWCRNKSSRPSSSHQDDRSAGEKETNKEKERSGKIFGRETNHLLA